MKKPDISLFHERHASYKLQMAAHTYTSSTYYYVMHQTTEYYSALTTTKVETLTNRRESMTVQKALRPNEQTEPHVPHHFVEKQNTTPTTQ